MRLCKSISVAVALSLSTISVALGATDSTFGTTDTVTISLIGDIMQHAGQRASALKKGEWSRYDYSSSFKYMEPLFKRADLMVANMEFTIGSQLYSGYPLFSAPAEIAYAAAESGIDLFLMANNHIADKGLTGLRKTFDCYKALGVMTMGAYENEEEREKNDPLFVTIKGIKFALINFTYDTNGMPVPPPYCVNIQDSTYILNVIKKAKEGNPDFIIALPHWGEEYQLKPSAEQIAYANLMLREGVDVIIGGHPHVPQEGYIITESIPYPHPPHIEKRVEKVLFFSLGNYVSNQSNPPYTQVGTFVELRFVKDSFTGEKQILMPQWEYTWCFRRNEFVEDYAVVPIEEFINYPQDTLQSTTQKASFERMKTIYNFIKEKQLITIE